MVATISLISPVSLLHISDHAAVEYRVLPPRRRQREDGDFEAPEHLGRVAAWALEEALYKAEETSGEVFISTCSPRDGCYCCHDHYDHRLCRM